MATPKRTSRRHGARTSVELTESRQRSTKLLQLHRLVTALAEWARLDARAVRLPSDPSPWEVRDGLTEVERQAKAALNRLDVSRDDVLRVQARIGQVGVSYLTLHPRSERDQHRGDTVIFYDPDAPLDLAKDPKNPFADLPDGAPSLAEVLALAYYGRACLDGVSPRTGRDALYLGTYSELRTAINALRDSRARLNTALQGAQHAAADKELAKFLDAKQRRDQKRHGRSRKHRERCRTIAAGLWERDSARTITDVVSSNELKQATDGREYGEDVLKGWVRDLCPNRKPGRPKKMAK